MALDIRAEHIERLAKAEAAYQLAHSAWRAADWDLGETGETFEAMNKACEARDDAQLNLDKLENPELFA